LRPLTCTDRSQTRSMVISFTATVGGGPVVLRDFSTGVNHGGSDRRKDGETIAEVPLGPQP
jgi:hypothetical protein